VVTNETGRTALRAIGQSSVLEGRTTDVARARERSRRSRLRTAALVLLPVFVGLSVRAALTREGLPGVHLPAGDARYLPAFVLVVLLGTVLVGPMLGAGRSPHVLYRPSEIDVRFSDVRGAAMMVDEAVKTLNLFLAHKTFTEEMGGTSRRAILFEGPPGTGKTHLAKAMAAEGGVPFLFVSASAFQSMYYGQTNRKVRSYFRALRAHARREGGAIGFIEEIDAIGASRHSMRAGATEGVSGVVNELLIQLQSFDQPTPGEHWRRFWTEFVNRWLPTNRQLRAPVHETPNVLVIGATNRAGDLDPALLRPGRFDRIITVDLPDRDARRELIDYYLGKKRHDPDLDDEDQEAIRQHAIAALNLTQQAKQVALNDATGGSELPANTAFVDGVRKFAMDVRDLDIDLIDRINPFSAAYAILAKTMTEESLKQVAAVIASKRVNLSYEDARALAVRALQFKTERGRPPNINARDPWEKRMAEGVAALARYRAQARATIDGGGDSSA